MTQVVQKSIKYSRAVNSSRSNNTGHWRIFTPYQDLKLSPCQNSCPCSSHIPEWLAAIKQEQWEKAWQIIQQTNPFPAITGQVCYHYCQDSCYRGQVDQAVAIKDIELEVGSWRHSRSLPPSRQVNKGRVAIVGSGPAGLSSAYYLRRRGIQVTIYDRAPVPGGALALAIPPYRFSRRILEIELEALARDGVRFKLNCELDQREISELTREYQAVFLATGASTVRLPDIPGLELGGVWTALDFLEEANLGENTEIADPVIVIGGGNTALDAARMALRQDGITEATVIYRRRHSDMKAYPAEIAAAEQEGVKFIFNTFLEAVCGTGKVDRVLCSPAESGGGGQELYRCGSLILATGQQPDESLAGLCIQDKALFAGGDLLTGPSSVPAAIDGGRRGAEAIISYLEGGKPEPFNPEKQVIAFSDLQFHSLPGFLARPVDDQLAQEAGRCLGCGSCINCGVCFIYCPDVAVFRDGEQYSINLDYCKGCGICAQECPTGVLEMRGVEGAR
ncbi:MAG TPA: FAD-dependent oxidoreductase [Firmicutes bacterium]|nr:FAD-dependent oxidoreductase [Bacillota bacterium]